MRKLLGIALLGAFAALLWMSTTSTEACIGDSIQGARDNTVRQDLFTLRHVLAEYQLDKKRRPQTLDDLVSAGYLRAVPVDPATRGTDWIAIWSDDSRFPGIENVRSASHSLACNGTRFDEW